jgi:CubicO group peptidase (beta-lactamase class C family)
LCKPHERLTFGHRRKARLNKKGDPMGRNALLSTLLAAGLLLAPGSVQGQENGATEGAFSTERLDRIATAMEREIEQGTMPGAVTLIAHQGEIVHLEAHGHRDGAQTEELQADDLFRSFSMTKPIVSVAAMMLVERGELALRDPLTRWFPEFADMTVLVEAEDGNGWEEVPSERPILVHDLLRHTSGFGYENNTPEPIATAYTEADIEARETDVSPEDFIARLAEIPLVHQPGTVWHYGVSTDVLGVLLERVTDTQLDQLLAEMIFEPLGMNDTMWQVGEEDLDRLADAFEADPQRASQWQWVRVEEDPGARYRLGGAGVVTTAEDFFRFAQMVLNRGELDGTRLLAPKTVDLMLSDHIAQLEGEPFGTTGPGYGFGLGFGVRLHDGVSWVPGSVGDAMWAGAGGTSFTIDPQEEIVGVFMAAAPTQRLHTRFLFKTLLYGAMTE